MAMEKFDVCVIGAGPGGYVAAIKAGQKGLKTALVEKGDFGGTCLNIGCIPTKTLIASAEVLHSARHAADFGVEISGEIKPNWSKMLKRKEDVLDKLRGGIAGLLKAAGVTVFKGAASFMNRQSVMVADGENAGATIQAKNFIIAVGSTSLVPGFIPQSPRIITSTELLSIPKVPKSLLVLGGGVIGCEFACLFAEMGTEVTVVEMLPSILPPIDRELGKTLSKLMEAKGIKIMTGAPLGDIKATAKGVTGMVGDVKVSAEYLLVSIGRKSVAGALNLGAAGVQTNERGWIPVNDYAQTNIPNIYAIGDATGKGMLAHWASAQAVAAVETIAGNRTALAADQIPGAIFTTPEIGSLGASEEQLKEKGVEYKVGKFPFAALGKAMAINETDGFVKILADAKTDAVLGVHIIGPHATDLIAEAAPVMKLECTAKELGKAIHAHPTIGEAIMEAAHAVHGESAHIPTRRR
ncbi:MAG: dihydrolipoyl dehydrogenase [Lentisphaerae bacterium]|nr:dihydrolipoyl dehydrogenase [Lentisphaerota bacterium]